MNRGHNRERIFDEPVDYQVFLHFIERAAADHGLDVHGFALMPNHFHLQITPHHAKATSKALQAMSSRYTTYYNRKHKRIGSIWNGRHKTVLLESSWQWLICLRYIDRNPIEAGLVEDPGAYPWTSYRAHALGGNTPHWLADHRVLRELGVTDADRQLFYRRLCAVPLTEAELTLMQHPLNQGTRSFAVAS
jgi:putative transposase